MTTPHRPNKSLGQNFLVDTRVQQKIVSTCLLKPEDTVVEIGPGKGVLTTLILPLVKKLVVVEKDRELVPLLKTTFQQPHLEIIEGDFLKMDMKALPDDLIVVGNIPYYISTSIIEKILEHKDKVKRAYLTVQLEFGERVAAKAGNKDYGSLSCFVQYYADVKILFKISPGSFHPQPKVHSCFLSLTMKDKPEMPAKDEKKLFALIQKAFMQRRKTIGNALKGTMDQEKLINELNRLGINLQSRPENLTLSHYIALSNLL
jgi:16S rRNA (adenine1518-N6/adenine1519-N6)-dimethyltransferase